MKESIKESMVVVVFRNNVYGVTLVLHVSVKSVNEKYIKINTGLRIILKLKSA